MSEIKLRIQPTVEEDVKLISTTLGAYTQIQAHSELTDVIIGDFTYCAGFNQISYAKIGKFCSIASFVCINPGNHPTYIRIAQHHFTYRSEMYGFEEDDAEFFEWRKSNSVTIGNDVWIGHNATIMPGITIGNGAVIGSGAVVTKNVEAYSVVAGVPAKRIRLRFNNEMIEKIDKTQWWNWDYNTIKERIMDFRNIDEFKRKYL